jgi:hypothetical protein
MASDVCESVGDGFVSASLSHIQDSSVLLKLQTLQAVT